MTISNTWATYEAQFMEKLSNTEAELKKTSLIKKRVILNLKSQNTQVIQLENIQVHSRVLINWRIRRKFMCMNTRDNQWTKICVKLSARNQ